MIEFTKGDMFKVSVDARVNTVNCVGVMGAGVALAFKNRYPEMFKEYQEACREGRVRPGVMHVWKNLVGEWVINFPTKRDWREPSRYEDILSGLDALRDYISEQGHISIAIPALGCGNGGLDWNKVAPMIKDKLGDLDARILVFEPGDSVNAGRSAQDQPTEEQLKAIDELGFRFVEFPQEEMSTGVSPRILIKGDESLVHRRWVALLPSRELGAREEAALKAIALQLALSNNPVAIALVHGTRTTERIVELFLNNGVPVILILPFGPLTRKSVGRTPTGNRPAAFAMISLAGPVAAWSRTTLAQSMNLLRAGAASVLLSDPAPKWLNSRLVHTWAVRPVFYVRYDGLPDETRRILDSEGARPIGRRPDTGEPNLARFFQASSVEPTSTTAH